MVDMHIHHFSIIMSAINFMSIINFISIGLNQASKIDRGLQLQALHVGVCGEGSRGRHNSCWRSKDAPIRRIRLNRGAVKATTRDDCTIGQPQVFDLNLLLQWLMLENSQRNPINQSNYCDNCMS